MNELMNMMVDDHLPHRLSASALRRFSYAGAGASFDHAHAHAHGSSSSSSSSSVDVDRMSYDELLALGDRMGVVKKRALTLEQISTLPTAKYNKKKKPKKQATKEANEAKDAKQGDRTLEERLAIRVNDAKRSGSSSSSSSSFSSSSSSSSIHVSDSDSDSDSDPESNCSICYCSFDEGDLICTLPCLHRFHEAEITKWLVEKSTCPICNSDIKEMLEK
jgi:hypothetical protein